MSQDVISRLHYTKNCNDFSVLSHPTRKKFKLPNYHNLIYTMVCKWHILTSYLQLHKNNNMSHYDTAPKDRIPFGEKAAYGTGTLVLNLLPAALGIFAFFLIFDMLSKL